MFDTFLFIKDCFDYDIARVSLPDPFLILVFIITYLENLGELYHTEVYKHIFICEVSNKYF